jgi:hypothetical protein
LTLNFDYAIKNVQGAAPSLEANDARGGNEMCSHNNIEQDKAARVYKCSACGEVVGHFLTVAERTERQSEIEQYAVRLRGLVSIGNGLYAKTGKQSR